MAVATDMCAMIKDAQTSAERTAPKPALNVAIWEWRMRMPKPFCLIFLVLIAAGCAPSEPLTVDRAGTGVAANPGTSPLPAPIDSRSFPSDLLNADVSYHIVLPPTAAQNTVTRYPVVYWLHGSGGYPPGVLQTLAGRFQQAMVEGKMPPAIIVFPDGFSDTMWANAADGSRPIEDMLIEELVPHIDANFRTIASPSARLIEGASMGGYGAARLAMLYPNVFGAVSMINPGPMQPVLDPQNAPLAGRERAIATLENVFGGDVRDFERRSPWTIAQAFAERDCVHMRIRMILGENDPITPTNLRFSQRLSQLGIAHDVDLVAGAGHDPRAMLANLGNHYWDFFSEAFTRNTDEVHPCR